MNKRVVRVIFQLILIVVLVPISGLVIFGCLFTLALVFPAPEYPIEASQFNTSHSFLPNDAPDNTIMPNQVDDFILVPSDYFSPHPNLQRQLTTTYKPQSQSGLMDIRLSAYLVTDKDFQNSFISEEARCSEYGNSTQIQVENSITYTYAYCPTLGYTALSLLWKNGDWVFKAESASIDQGDADLLVQFINDYPF